MKKIKLDTKGYQNLLRELTKQEELLHNLRFKRGSEKNKINRWYDDPTNYQNHLEEQVIIKKINMLKEQITCAKIVDALKDTNRVDLDDVIKLDVFNTSETKEEMLIKLVGGLGNFNVEPLEVSVNSPLGDAIYNKDLGSIASYKVNNELFSVVIKEKMKN